MTTPQDSTQLESYVPVYDVVPEKWEDARAFLVETLKKITNSLNAKEIGFFLDEELLSGKQLFPGTPDPANPPSSQINRSILRKVIDFSPLNAGANSKAHNITVDAKFSLTQLFAAATDAVAFTSTPIPNTTPASSITMDAANINITSTNAYTRCFAVVEYIQEL